MVELVETALLLTVPAADPALAPHRRRLDRAARVGVAAHVTVVFPFVPYAALRTDDLHRLGTAASSVPSFTLRFAETGWFGDEVTFLVPEPAAPVLALVEAVVAAFPEHPPYAGEHAEVVPHLTVGHDAPAEQLRVAETAVRSRLPVAQEVSALELWAGPPLVTEEPGWRQVASFALG